MNTGDHRKTKAQLIEELMELRTRLMETAETPSQPGPAKHGPLSSDDPYRAFMENSQGIGFRRDMHFRSMFFHGAVEQITGYIEENFVSGTLTWDKIVHPDDLHIFIEETPELTSIPLYSTEREYRIVRKDGQIRWVNERVQNQCDESGKPAYVQGMIFDITERKQAEEALRESEAGLRSVFRAAPTGIGVVVDRVLKQVNERMCEMVGYSEEELIGQNARMLYASDEEYEYVGREKYEQISDHGTGTVETCLKCKDGRIIDVLLSSTPIDLDDLSKGVTFTALDITDRKQAEEALRKSEAKLAESNLIMAEVLAHTHILVTLLDPQFNFVWVNRAYADAGRQESSFFPGKNHFDLYPHEENQVIFQRVVDTGEPFFVTAKPFEYPDQPERGVTYWDWSLIPVKDHSGKVTSLVFTLADVTEHQKMEKERENLQAQLSQAQKVESIGRLAGSVAHDLNNLLSPILGYGEMLLLDFDPHDQRRGYVDEIVRAGSRARDLVQQLLAFGRRQVLDPKPLNLNIAVTGFEKLLRRSIREDIDIEIIKSPDIRNVMADDGQIELVIMNLAVNAQDAMSDGGRLTIETAPVVLDEDYAAKHTDVQPGEYVMLAISDTGCGMDDETREHIFEPFFTTKGKLGSGLGLATVYGIVKQHGGNIRVDSEPGKGAILKVYLPVSEETHVDKETTEKTALVLEGSETILLVEDDEQVRELSKAILKRQGYTVLEAENGPEALAALAAHNGLVHLLLTDVVMPGMNGKELFVKACEKYPGLKVLYMSGYTDDIIAHRGVLEKGTVFIQKPFTVQALAAKVRKVLEQD